MKLSVKAKPFISTKPSGTIVSWNVLSDTLTDAIANSVCTNTESALFPTSFFRKRIKYVEEKLQNLIKQLKYPIFCLQEVNDAKDESQSMVRVLTRLFQEKRYRVLCSNFGTFDHVYPELGVLVAIPEHLYDVLTFRIQQIAQNIPNTFIQVKLRAKTSTESFTVVNTHFPAKYNDTTFMKHVTESFLHHLGLSTTNTPKRMVLCGNFNTTIHNAWYPSLRHGFHTWTHQDDKISHLSIQRRDRRVTYNTVFQDFLDHFFWTRDISIHFISDLPERLSIQEMEALKRPSRNDKNVLPSVQNPSDHYPLEVSFHLL